MKRVSLGGHFRKRANGRIGMLSAAPARRLLLLAGMLLLILGVANLASACAPTWSVGTAGITEGTIEFPSPGRLCAINDVLCCQTTHASDLDHRYADQENPTDSDECDTFTYTWTATGGSFVGGNTGRIVGWQAPPTPSAGITITCTISDDHQIPEGETGDRDDADVQRSVTVKVVKVDLGAEGTTEENEETTGAFLGVGKRIELTLSLLPTALNTGTLTLLQSNTTNGTGSVTFWDSETGGNQVTDLSWEIGTETYPPTLYAEGVTGSSSLRDTILTLRCTSGGTTVNEDKAKLTVMTISGILDFGEWEWDDTEWIYKCLVTLSVSTQPGGAPEEGDGIQWSTRVTTDPEGNNLAPDNFASINGDLNTDANGQAYATLEWDPIEDYQGDRYIWVRATDTSW